MKAKIFTFRVSPELISAVEKYAAENGMTASDVFRLGASEYISKELSEARLEALVRKAVADVIAGNDF